jgi:hypothetical protein
MGRGRGVYEQVLDIYPEERETMWQALSWNVQPENSVYRYSFFFDNCATRPAFMIENALLDAIKYAPQTGRKTFRDVINYCTRNHPWVTFGCDIVVGLPADRVMTLKETFFIPAYLQEAFDKAEISRSNSVIPLIRETITINKNTQQDPSPFFLTSPLACFTLLFFFLLTLTYSEWRNNKKYYRWVDCVLFFAAGIAGCIVYFLSFFSVHPSMFPNLSVLWLHPFHLLGVIFFSVKKFKSMAFRYHFINFAAILILSVAWLFIPQHFNIAFIPLIASLALRSGWRLLRKKISLE